MVESLIYRFFSDLTSEFPNKAFFKETETQYNLFFNSLLVELKESISENDFSISKFSKENNISRGYLNNIFVKNMGITLANYLLKLRMEKAKIDLSSTTKMIKEMLDVLYPDVKTYDEMKDAFDKTIDYYINCDPQERFGGKTAGQVRAEAKADPEHISTYKIVSDKRYKEWWDKIKAKKNQPA